MTKRKTISAFIKGDDESIIKQNKSLYTKEPTTKKKKKNNLYQGEGENEKRRRDNVDNYNYIWSTSTIHTNIK